MFQNEYELVVDLKKKMTSVVPTFVQYDNAKLIFKIFDNGKPYDLSSFTKAEVSHKRSDGKTIVGTASIIVNGTNKGSIVYTYLGNEMSKEGFNETSLSIFSEDKKVSIQPFNVKIITDLRDGLVESSKEESGILQELIAQVGALVDSASKAVVNAERAVIDAEQAVINAKLAQQTAQTAADGANLAKDGAILATQSATDATNATTTAIANTEIATTNADIATGIANTSASNADTKATLAETAASKVDAKITLVDQAIIDSQTATAGVITAINETNIAKDAANLATDRANTATTNANDKASLAEQATISADSSALNADNKAILAEQKANLADVAAINANLATDAINLALPNIEGWVNKGEYSATIDYAKHNMVTLNGSTYQAKTKTTGNPPTDTLYWSLMAQRGVDGTGSVVSVNNIPPDMNGNVDIGAISSTWVDITGKPSEFPPATHPHVISDVTGLQTALDNAGTKDIATPLINGLMSKEDKIKLNGVESGANKYTHPATHPASMITGIATVATSGSYNDLINKPVLGTASSKNVGIVNGNIPVIGVDGKLAPSVIPVSGVQTVNGKTGAVTLEKSDVGLLNVDNVKQASKVEFDSHATDTVKHVDDIQRSLWNGKYTLPVTGIPKTDLAVDIQSTLNKADTAIQDISGLTTKPELELKSTQILGEANLYTDDSVKDLNVFVKQDIFIATEGQALFTLTDSYNLGQSRLKVTVGGVPQDAPENFTETSTTSFTLSEGLPAGERVVATYYSALSPISTDVEGRLDEQEVKINTLNADVLSVGGQVSANELSGEVQFTDIKSRLGVIESGAGKSVVKVDGLNREVSYLKLKQDAKDRLVDERGVTFADAMDGNSFGMTLNEAESQNIVIRNGKMLMNDIVTINHSAVDEVVVNKADSTTGNGGRKLVKLSNGDLITAVRGSGGVMLYKKAVSGTQWEFLHQTGDSSSTDTAIVPMNNNLIGILYNISNTTVYFRSVDFIGGNVKIKVIDTGQTAIGNVSLAIDPTNGHLHAAWASKNATYLNSFNIRYSKSIDGGVTWSVVEQLTTYNSSGLSGFTTPSIVIRNNSPVILTYYSHIKGIIVLSPTIVDKYTGVSIWGNAIVYGNTNYEQSSPSAVVDKDGVIHVAWQGKDSVQPLMDNIRYSKSSDGGVTWSAVVKLTSSNTLTSLLPTITVGSNGVIGVIFVSAGLGSYQNIASVYFDGAWSEKTFITSKTGGYTSSPNALVDLSVNYTKPLFIYEDNQDKKVGFYGTWIEQVEVPKTTATAVYNLPSTDYVGAFVQKIGAVTATAFLNDLSMGSDLLDGEYLFDKSLPAKAPAKLRIELSRPTDTGNEADAVTRILGGRS